MQRRVPSVEKLYQLTGFRPKIGLREMVDSTAEYQRSNMVAVS
jgi:hypothetical protein